MILIGFCVITFLYSFKKKTYDFSRKRIKLFLMLTAYFFLLIISAIYSENTDEAGKRIIQLIPLLVVPGVLIFFKPTFSDRIKNSALELFVIVNLIYAIILGILYILALKDGFFEFNGFYNFILSYDKIQFILNDYLSDDVFFIHKAYTSMGFVICAIYTLTKGIENFKVNKKKAAIYLLLFICFSFLITFMFSFSNVLSFVICTVLVLSFYLKGKQTIYKKKGIIFLLVFLGLLSVGVVFKYQDNDVKRGFNFLTSIAYSEDVEVNDARLEIYKTYQRIYNKSTVGDFILGYGVGDVQDLLNNEYKKRLQENENKNVNLTLFSEEFNHDYWFKNNLDVTPNIESSPTGDVKADLIFSQKSNIPAAYNLSITLMADTKDTYTFSVFAKRRDSKKLILRLGDITSQRVTFDLEKGIVDLKGKDIIEAKISLLDNSWYRCSLTTTVEGEPLAVIGLTNDRLDYNYVSNTGSLYLWGAQIEKNSVASPYHKNRTELLNYANKEELNTHNNYLHFLMAGGVFCLLGFLISIGKLSAIAIKNKNVFQISFVIIVALNLVTENSLSRHWGLMFFSVMMILFFTESTNQERKNNEI